MKFLAILFTLLVAPLVALWDLLTGTVGFFTNHETGNGSGAMGALLGFITVIAGLILWAAIAAITWFVWFLCHASS